MPDLDDASFEYALHPYVVPKWVEVKHKSIPHGELGVRRGAKVKAIDGSVGRVDEFVVEPGSGEITHLVLQDGHLWDQEEVTIPIRDRAHRRRDRSSSPGQKGSEGAPDYPGA
jgi:hypothetical protein